MRWNKLVATVVYTCFYFQFVGKWAEISWLPHSYIPADQLYQNYEHYYDINSDGTVLTTFIRGRLVFRTLEVIIPHLKITLTSFLFQHILSCSEFAIIVYTVYVFGQTDLSKLCRPRRDATDRGVSSGSTLFATHPAICRHNIRKYTVLVQILEQVW